MHIFLAQTDTQPPTWVNLAPVTVLIGLICIVFYSQKRAKQRRDLERAERLVTVSSNLIQCPTCRREVSSHAVACPQCGHPFRVQKDYAKQTNLWLRLILIAIGIPVIAVSLKSCIAER